MGCTASCTYRAYEAQWLGTSVVQPGSTTGTSCRSGLWCHSTTCPSCPAWAPQVRMPNGEPVRLRVGVHTGPCVSGLVGLGVPKVRVHLQPTGLTHPPSCLIPCWLCVRCAVVCVRRHHQHRRYGGMQAGMGRDRCLECWHSPHQKTYAIGALRDAKCCGLSPPQLAWSRRARSATSTSVRAPTACCRLRWLPSSAPLAECSSR